MEPTLDFASCTTGAIATWHGVSQPHPVAAAMIADLTTIISDFEAMRGALRFEDEPASFEAELLRAADPEALS